MRGSWRLRRVLRRLEGRLQRPAPPIAPETLLAAALAPSQLRAGRPDAARLREAFRPIHGPAALDALAMLPGADDGLTAMAEGAARGALPWFDRILPAALPPDWLRVPGGARWPLLPETAHQPEDFIRHGDIALLWELGRLQALPALAAAARVTGDPAPARLGLDLLADFRRANPVGWGPHWLSGLEAALRIHSLLWAWMLLPDPGAADTLLLAASLVENARYIETHLSLKAIANNHLVGEASGLHALGCALPCLTGASRWRERGRELLDRELPRQILPDGVDGEQAVSYHRFVLELYLHAVLWSRAAGDDPAPAWRSRLAAMLPPLAALTGPDGRLVALGDDSGARVLRLDGAPLADARGLVDAAARLLGAAVPGSPAGPPRGTGLWLLGPQPPARPPAGEAAPAASFPDAGWYAARFGPPVSGGTPDTGDTPERGAVAGGAPVSGGVPGGHLVFRAGPMGRGGAGHSHLDLLALTLSLNGEPILVDPGTYLYNAPLPWRDRFRGAGGHSLLRAGGGDPARPVAAPDRFGWVTRARAVLEDAATGEPPWLWQGLREGDRDGAGRPLAVSRALVLLPPGWLVVLDEVVAAGGAVGGHAAGDVAAGGAPEGAAAAGAGDGGEPVPLELLWQCAPGLSARWDADGGPRRESEDMACRFLRLARGERTVLEALLFAPAGLAPRVRTGETSPPAGWAAPDYGVKAAAPEVALAGAAPLPARLVSVLIDPAGPPLASAALSWGPRGEARLELAGEDGGRLRLASLPRGAAPAPLGGWTGGPAGDCFLAAAVLGPGGEVRGAAALTRRLAPGAVPDPLAPDSAADPLAPGGGS